MIRKIFKSILIGLFFIGLGIFAKNMLVSMKKEVAKVNEDKVNAVQVRVQELKPIQEVIEVSNYGTLQPRSVVSLNAELDARVVRIHPNLLEGNLVSQNDVLIELDKRDYQIVEKRNRANLQTHDLSLESLKIEGENLNRNLNVLQRQLDIAEKEKLRYEVLLKEKSVSPSEYNRVESSYQTAKVTLTSTENAIRLLPVRQRQVENLQALENIALEQALLNLKRTDILAPFHGRILKKYIEPDQYVRKGDKLLDIYDTSILEVRIPMPASELEWLLPDYYYALNRNPSKELAPVKMEDCIVKIYLARDRSNVFWEGKLKRLAPEIDPATRTLGMIVEIANIGTVSSNKPTLLKGMFVKAVFQSMTLRGVYKVPRNLISNENKVLLFEQGKLRVREVRIVRYHNDFAYISEGLKLGEQLITTIPPNVVDGMDVIVSDLSLENGKKL